MFIIEHRFRTFDIVLKSNFFASCKKLDLRVEKVPIKLIENDREQIIFFYQIALENKQCPI